MVDSPDVKGDANKITASSSLDFLASGPAVLNKEFGSVPNLFSGANMQVDEDVEKDDVLKNLEVVSSKKSVPHHHPCYKPGASDDILLHKLSARPFNRPTKTAVSEAGNHSRQFKVSKVDETNLRDTFKQLQKEKCGVMLSTSCNYAHHNKTDLLKSKRGCDNSVSGFEDLEMPECGLPLCPGDCVADDICMLCKTTEKSMGGGLALDDHPGVIRWQKLPCRCLDKYLHVVCLETRFQEDSVYKSGHRRLILNCSECNYSLIIRRHRSRRNCDKMACLSFLRHLVSTFIIVGFVLGFGLWSMLDQSRDGKPNIVNVSLLCMGVAITIVFIVYELWLINSRFDFSISPAGKQGKIPHNVSKQLPSVSEMSTVDFV